MPRGAPAYDATATFSRVDGHVCFQASAELILTAGMRREADIHRVQAMSAKGQGADVIAGVTERRRVEEERILAGARLLEAPPKSSPTS